MANTLLFGKDEVTFLCELVRQKVDFMVVGLSAAALQGAPVVTQDIDLWFKNLTDPGIKKALRKAKGAYIPPTAMTPPMFAGEGVSLFDIVVHMHGLGHFDQEKTQAVRVPLGRFKIHILPLERIIASKKAAGRKRDRLVMKVLSDALKAVQARERRRRG